MMMDILVMLAMLAPGGHPRLYHDPASLTRAMDNVQHASWALAYRDSTIAAADKWAAKPSAELRALVPAPGSTFAYGFDGCPSCGANWPWWGAQISSFDMPGRVTCPECRKVFPNDDFPDPGGGWRNPETGKVYYTVGCYNAYAARQINLNILPSLARAYALTKDRKYSNAAAVIFDRLAELYPVSTVGSADYPSNPNSGRLEQPQYQVARILVVLANALDLLYDSPEFGAPSTSGKGSVRDHIKTAIIADGGKYCYDMAARGYCRLTNGQADYIRGTLAAGIMTDNKLWIDYAIKGPYNVYNFLDNCLDRDGQNYETSIGYSGHAIGLYLDMAEMLYHLSTEEYPEGINLYEHPKFQKALSVAMADIDCFGHSPRFGDSGPDFSVVSDDAPFSARDMLWAEHLAAHARDTEQWSAMRNAIARGDVEARRNEKAMSGSRSWLTFHASPATKTKKRVNLEPRTLLGGRGVTILRSGKGSSGRAALLRYGPCLNHGHRDDLNLNFFGLGRELTYDFGYYLGSAHVQVGLANTTASHNLVVVNEQNQMKAGGGGDLYFCTDAAPVRAVEASSEACYASENVKTYRRTLAMVDIGKGSYLVDIFRTAGGNQHDLMWHFAGKQDSVTGAALGEAQKTGSLAGEDIDWGRHVGSSGYLRNAQDKGGYWNPPPGNGYGFFYDVRRAKADGACSATWKLTDDNTQRLKLTLLPEPGCELITASAPGILPDYPKADFAILRRKGADLSSTFVSIVEPSDTGGAVLSADRMRCESGDAVGVEIKTTAGFDYVLSSLSGKPSVLLTNDGQRIDFEGRFGFIRIEGGKVASSRLVGGTNLAIGSYTLKSNKGVEGGVKEINYELSKITIDRVVTDLPEIVYFSRDGYSHSSPYLVKSVDGPNITLDGDFVIGRGQIGQDGPKYDSIGNVVPLPRSIIVSGAKSDYFRGKLIVNDRTKKSTTVINVESDQITVRVNDPSIFSAGDSFTIYDVQPGDTLSSPLIIGK